MNAEEVAMALFFTVTILSLALLSYFASDIGNHGVGYCPTPNPYMDKKNPPACHGGATHAFAGGRARELSRRATELARADVARENKPMSKSK